MLGWVAAFVWACTGDTKSNRRREQENLSRLIALQTGGGQGQPVAALPSRCSREKNLFYLALLIVFILYVFVVGTRGDKKDQAATETPITMPQEITTGTAKLSPVMSQVAPEVATSTQAVAADKPASPAEVSPVPTPEVATSTQAVAADKPASPAEVSPVPAPPALPKPPRQTRLRFLWVLVSTTF